MHLFPCFIEPVAPAETVSRGTGFTFPPHPIAVAEAAQWFRGTRSPFRRDWEQERPEPEDFEDFED